MMTNIESHPSFIEVRKVSKLERDMLDEIERLKIENVDLHADNRLMASNIMQLREQVAELESSMREIDASFTTQCDSVDPDIIARHVKDELRKIEDRVVAIDAALECERRLFASSEERGAELEQRIKYAMDYANGRWCEWGDRAMFVESILDGDEPTPKGGETEANNGD